MRIHRLFLALVSASILAIAPGAQADPAAEAKAATKIENREPVDPGTSFKSGDTVYVWSSVTGAEGKTVQHVWKKDGKELRRAQFPVKSARWRVNSKLQYAAAGEYVVEVVAEEQKLTEVSFKVE